MQRSLFILFLLLIPSILHGQKYYDFDAGCHRAMDEIYKLRLGEASEIISEVESRNPDNLISLLLQDYIDFFRIYVSEDELLYHDLMDRRHDRLKLLKEGPEDSPYYLYCLAETYLHWAIARLKFEEYMGAFVNVRKAYHLLEENREKFPDFVHNLKSLAVLHAVIGSIPDDYKWGADILGLEGSIQQGTREFEVLIAYCAQHNFPFHEEVQMMQAFLQLHLFKNPERAWDLVNEEGFLKEDNLLAHFTKASIASYTAHNESVIETINDAPRGPAYLDLYFLDYLKGMALIRKLDPKGVEYLEKYIANFEGRNYIKEAWQKIGWFYLIQGNMEQYEVAMKKVKEEGFAIVDEDKAALAEAEHGSVPHPLLLEARLLFDGGYYQAAFEKLKGKSVEDFDTQRDRLEFTYRAGRIFQNLGKPEKAKGFFYATLKNQESKNSFYFAPNACLQLGYIFRGEGDTNRAKYYFKKAIAYKNHSFENGIESQAKAALEGM